MHRAQQTAKVGFLNVRAHPHNRPANLYLHAPRPCGTRLRRSLALGLLRPESSSATRREKLRPRVYSVRQKPRRASATADLLTDAPLRSAGSSMLQAAVRPHLFSSRKMEAIRNAPCDKDQWAVNLPPKVSRKGILAKATAGKKCK